MIIVLNNFNLKVNLFNSVLTQTWVELQKNLQCNPDTVLFNTVVDPNQFKNLIEKTNKEFGFNWKINPKTQEDYNSMHKDIETASNENKAKLQKVHNLLHVYENKHDSSATQLQLVWSDSLGKFYKKKAIKVAMPSKINSFFKQVKRGDVILGYPHVGKSPESCLKQNDNTKLYQTCRLHDTVATDIVVILKDTICSTTESQLLEWYDANKDSIANTFTKEDMLKYHGYAKIGEVADLSMLNEIEKLKSFKYLELQI